MTNIILCGGNETHLWQGRRALMPKQFVKVFDKESFFSLLRILDKIYKMEAVKVKS